jgi:aquaporin related protein
MWNGSGFAPSRHQFTITNKSSKSFIYCIRLRILLGDECLGFLPGQRRPLQPSSEPLLLLPLEMAINVIKVTLGLLLAGALTPLRALVVFIAQLISGICAAAVADALVPGPLSVSTKLGGGTSVARGLFIEMFLTAELVFVVLMLAVEKHKATHMAPIGIGIALFIIHLAGINYTGASANPARSFGPEVVSGFEHYDWIYWVGPLLGSLLASGLYRLLKFLIYETANPGQDLDERGTEAFCPPANAKSAVDV